MYNHQDYNNNIEKPNKHLDNYNINHSNNSSNNNDQNKGNI